jgi:hypothetical protein
MLIAVMMRIIIIFTSTVNFVSPKLIGDLAHELHLTAQLLPKTNEQGQISGLRMF